MIAWLIAFLTFVAIIVRAILSVISSIDDEKEFDLDFACELIDAPVIVIILILLVGGDGIAFVVSLGLSHGMQIFLRDGTYVKNLQAIE